MSKRPYLAKAPIPILMYHSISNPHDKHFWRFTLPVQRFVEQVSFLALNDYHTLTVRELSEALRLGLPLPEKTALLTFDDGFLDFYTQALPVLKEYGCAGTLFVPTGFVGGSSRWLVDEGEGNRPILTWQQLREVARNGVEVGGHSQTHARLDQVPPQIAWQEISNCRQALQDNLDCQVNSFAYPFGYYNRQVRQMVIEAGYSAACAVKHTPSSLCDDRFALRRLMVSSELDLQGFARTLEHRSSALEVTLRDLRETAANFVRRRQIVRQAALTPGSNPPI